MTTPDDRPFSDDDDRRMTDADRDALDPDRRERHATDGTTDLATPTDDGLPDATVRRTPRR